LSAEELPPGVEAKVEVGKDPAKQVLRLTASADANDAGPFRIVGRAGSHLRTATAPLPAPFDGAPTARVHHLWLTIMHPPAGQKPDTGTQRPKIP
jgi:hypothetical protein